MGGGWRGRGGKGGGGVGKIGLEKGTVMLKGEDTRRCMHGR